MRWRSTLMAVVAGLVSPQAAQAAELRLSLTELASMLTAAVADTKVRLDNVPGASTSRDGGSYLAFGSAMVPIPIPAKSFSAEDGSYAYYVNNLTSGPITVRVVPSALRLTVPFETHGAAVVGHCLNGLCVPDDSLPEVQWNNGTVTMDFKPVAVKGSVSLVLQAVDIGGTFAPDCRGADDLIAKGICGLVLSKAKETVGSLKTALDENLKDEINSADTQDELSAAIGGYLKFGPAGHVQISSVVVDDANVVLTFCVGCGGAAGAVPPPVTPDAKPGGAPAAKPATPVTPAAKPGK